MSSRIEIHEMKNPADYEADEYCEYCGSVEPCDCLSPCCGAYMGGGNGDGSYSDYGICPDCQEHC